MGVNYAISDFLYQLAHSKEGEKEGRMKNYLSAANQVSQLSDPICHKFVKGKKVLVYVHEGVYYDRLLYVGNKTEEKIIEFLNRGRNHRFCKHVDANWSFFAFEV